MRSSQLGRAMVWGRARGPIQEILFQFLRGVRDFKQFPWRPAYAPDEETWGRPRFPPTYIPCLSARARSKVPFTQLDIFS